MENLNPRTGFLKTWEAGRLTTMLACFPALLPSKDNPVHTHRSLIYSLPCLQATGAGPSDPTPIPVLTGKDLILQITTFFSGTYLALPTLVLKRGESASLGTGTDISTPLATDCFLNCPLAC